MGLIHRWRRCVRRLERGSRDGRSRSWARHHLQGRVSIFVFLMRKRQTRQGNRDNKREGGSESERVIGPNYYTELFGGISKRV